MGIYYLLIGLSCLLGALSLYVIHIVVKVLKTTEKGQIFKVLWCIIIIICIVVILLFSIMVATASINVIRGLV